MFNHQYFLVALIYTTYFPINNHVGILWAWIRNLGLFKFCETSKITTSVGWSFRSKGANFSLSYTPGIVLYWFMAPTMKQTPVASTPLKLPGRQPSLFPGGELRVLSQRGCSNLLVVSGTYPRFKGCDLRLGENLKDAVYPMSQT